MHIIRSHEPAVHWCIVLSISHRRVFWLNRIIHEVLFVKCILTVVGTPIIWIHELRIIPDWGTIFSIVLIGGIIANLYRVIAHFELVLVLGDLRTLLSKNAEFSFPRLNNLLFLCSVFYLVILQSFNITRFSCSLLICGTSSWALPEIGTCTISTWVFDVIQSVIDNIPFLWFYRLTLFFVNMQIRMTTSIAISFTSCMEISRVSDGWITQWIVIATDPWSTVIFVIITFKVKILFEHLSFPFQDFSITFLFFFLAPKDIKSNDLCWNALEKPTEKPVN